MALAPSIIGSSTIAGSSAAIGLSFPLVRMLREVDVHVQIKPCVAPTVMTLFDIFCSFGGGTVSSTVHHLTAADLIVGPPPQPKPRRHRRRMACSPRKKPRGGCDARSR